MVNTIILNYLRDNVDKFSVEDLKKMIILKGYPEEEFDEALSLLRGQVEPPVNTSSQLNLSTQNYPTNQCYVNPKLFVLAMASGFLISLILFLYITLKLFGIDAFGTTADFGHYLFLILFTLITSLFLIYIFGFYLIGKKSDLGFLKFSSKVLMIAVTVFLLLFLIINFSSNFLIDSISTDPQTATYLKNMVGNDMNSYASFLDDTSFKFNLPFWIWLLVSFSISVILFIFIFGYLFSYSILKVGDRFKFSLTLGITNFILLGLSNLFFFYLAYKLFHMLINPDMFLSIVFSIYDKAVFLERTYFVLLFLFILALSFGSLLILKYSRARKGGENLQTNIGLNSVVTQPISNVVAQPQNFSNNIV